MFEFLAPKSKRNTLSSAVVQIRLDFEAFVVRQPETTGSCDDDTIKFTTPTGNGMALPTLCGTLTDQHSKCQIFFIVYERNTITKVVEGLGTI